MLILYLKTSNMWSWSRIGLWGEETFWFGQEVFNEVHVQDLDLCSKSLTNSTLWAYICYKIIQVCDSDEVFFPDTTLTLDLWILILQGLAYQLTKWALSVKYMPKLHQGRENIIWRTNIFCQDPYLIHVPKKLVQGHRTLTMTILWLKHEQEMIYNLNKDFTNDSALTITLNQDRILFQGHLTPFNKRQFAGNSDLIYDKGGVWHNLCYYTAAYHTLTSSKPNL